MKYLIQIMNKNAWQSTKWGGDDPEALEALKERAENILKTNNKDISRVRVVEVLFEMGK
jgi:hypothetical protein